MTSHAPAKDRDHDKPDALSKFLAGLGVRRFAHLAEKTGLGIDRLTEWRDDWQRPIRYVDGLRIANASGGEIKIEDIFARDVPDRSRFDTPLGRKIALCLVEGPTLSSLLTENGITHVELGRWLTENTKWQKETRQRIRKAFACEGVEITDDDFEEHMVDRLRTRYEEARDELARKRKRRRS